MCRWQGRATGVGVAAVPVTLARRAPVKRAPPEQRARSANLKRRTASCASNSPVRSSISKFVKKRRRTSRRDAWIDEHRDQYSVTRLSQILGVSRSGYCQWRTRPPSRRAVANAELVEQVAAIHRDSLGVTNARVSSGCCGHRAASQSVTRAAQLAATWAPCGLQTPISGNDGLRSSSAGSAQSAGGAAAKGGCESHLSQRHHVHCHQ